MLVGAGQGDRGRLLGVEAAWPRKALEIEGVTFVGVEADGSAGRPFKAPARNEPVLPEGTTHLIAVVGVEALGKPLEARFVHRPERVMALTGAKAGDEVTALMIATVLAHEDGGRKGIPEGASFLALVTRASRNPAGARAIGKACHAAGVEHTVGYDAAVGLVEPL